MGNHRPGSDDGLFHFQLDMPDKKPQPKAPSGSSAGRAQGSVQSQSGYARGSQSVNRTSQNRPASSGTYTGTSAGRTRSAGTRSAAASGTRTAGTRSAATSGSRAAGPRSAAHQARVQPERTRRAALHPEPARPGHAARQHPERVQPERTRRAAQEPAPEEHGLQEDEPVQVHGQPGTG